MSKDFMSVIKNRRSIYGITKESTISDDKLKEMIQEVVRDVPSAFHSQSAKIVLLLGEHHDKLWEITKDTLRKIVPEDQFGATEEKLNSFQDGYGTILYFDDTNITNELSARFELYKDNFPVWAQHANGMLQYALWNLLEMEGLGASLQHYNPLIDEAVTNQWNIPKGWKMIAQMPFGKPTGDGLREKEYLSIESRMKVFQ